MVCEEWSIKSLIKDQVAQSSNIVQETATNVNQADDVDMRISTMELRIKRRKKIRHWMHYL